MCSSERTIFSGYIEGGLEECHKPEEADDTPAHYRSIVTRIRQQMEAQP
ncbi:MAG: hypothetical protein H7Y43_16100 [Akkermansiaceae bacterium]|nr:hypothetical protein [Verrucomicrobiales bacterium]